MGKYKARIIDGLKRDICQFDFPTTEIGKLKSKRAIAARDIVLPMVERMSDAWLSRHEDLDIMEITLLEGGQPSMKRVQRYYPELLQGENEI